MNIVFVSSMVGYPWGGSEVLWSKTALRLREMGHQVGACIAGRDEPRPQIEQLRAKGISVLERRWLPNTRWERVKHKITKAPLPDKPKETYDRWLETMQPDLVCISHATSACGSSWMLDCLDNGIPYVSVSQANAEYFWVQDHTRDDVLASFTGARRVYFVSKGNFRLFERQLGARLDNAEVIRNPINIDRARQIEWPEPLGETLKLACVARLDPKAKGQDLILETLSRKKWKDRNLRISFFGAGNGENGLKGLAELLGLSDQVQFCGHSHDIEGIWETHHALILPSRFEGLPLALVEAMFCGRPVITTDVAGNAELLEDNKTGFIAPTPTLKDVEATMERAWLARGRWRQMGELARSSIGQRIPENPTEVFANKLIQLCQ